MQFKRTLVTGGAGFIGSHLAEYLLKNNHQVTVIDDLSTGKWQNIEALERHPQFRVIISSVNQRLMENEIPRHDIVYHLASAVGVKLIMEKPVLAIENIFQATDVVFKACAKYRKPVLLTSSSEVYGKTSTTPFVENSDVVMGCTEKRRWAYACAKALDEFLGLAHYFETNLPVFIVRLFNTVGPRQRGSYGMVLPNFIRQALANQPLTVHEKGEQSRCFCSVTDVVEGLYKIPQNPEAAGQVVNLGSQEEITILDLANKVIELTNSQSKIEFIPYEQVYGPGFDDMQRRIPSLERATRLINWQPKHSLNDIILKITECQKTHQ